MRHTPCADACIQLIEDRVQTALPGLTCGHLEQDLARFFRGVLDRPADLAVGDLWITIVIELKSQCGVRRWTDDVLRLMYIRQGMSIGARRRSARRTSCGGGRRIADLTRGGIRPHGKRTQPGRALSPALQTPGCPRWPHVDASPSLCASHTAGALSPHSQRPSPQWPEATPRSSVKYLGSRSAMVLPRTADLRGFNRCDKNGWRVRYQQARLPLRSVYLLHLRRRRLRIRRGTGYRRPGPSAPSAAADRARCSFQAPCDGSRVIEGSSSSPDNG